MPVWPSLASILQRTRAWPVTTRYAATLALVLAVFAARHAFAAGQAPGYAFGHFLIAVLAASALFDHGAGFFATALGALLGTWLYLPPTGSLLPMGEREWIALGLFVAVGVAMSVVIEALHRAVAQLQAMNAALLAAERARGILLREFRHRTRNDLGSLVGLLMLRARLAPSAAAREALREAADHALALSRVHARLELDDGLDRGEEEATVDTRHFVQGLCADIEAAQFNEGLRPVRLVASAESHPLSAERAVPLGLVLNETVTNALKYAFPEARSGIVRVRFARDGESFVLTVADDGIGIPPEAELEDAPPAAPAGGAGLGTRLLRALAAQLRGRFARRPGEDGRGTVAELRFVAAPPRGSGMARPRGNGAAALRGNGPAAPRTVSAR
ncbi:sensor histidine kinase [Falsiroseomonas sp. HW251]|uniref:sensor histidine kinase n=1 Tax=Falsiroseomonas sp. HW251 TaxID=3390998 RepID=UPI003D31719F